jgi:CDP-diacylglycerol--glycerol-3-phosphate 3-phosphatidyltransferase
LFREVFAWPYRIALLGFYRAGFRPWQLTALSVVANAYVGWLLLQGDRFVPGLLLIVAGLFDIFDGGVARLRGEAGPAGAFLDSVMDRISDMILFGTLFWSEAEQGRQLTAALSLSSLIVSLQVSYIRAEAESVGLKLTEGMMQRLERYVALMIGLTAPGALLPVLVILTGLGGLTALQRALSTWAQLRRAEAREARGLPSPSGPQPAVAPPTGVVESRGALHRDTTTARERPKQRDASYRPEVR